MNGFRARYEIELNIIRNKIILQTNNTFFGKTKSFVFKQEVFSIFVLREGIWWLGRRAAGPSLQTPTSENSRQSPTAKPATVSACTISLTSKRTYFSHRGFYFDE
jgi:hypothetical protein